MARTYNIALYKISIYPLRKPDNKLVLSDFLNGKDLKNILYEMLKSLCYTPQETSEEEQDEDNDAAETEEGSVDETKVDKAESKYFRIIKKKEEQTMSEEKDY